MERCSRRCCRRWLMISHSVIGGRCLSIGIQVWQLTQLFQFVLLSNQSYSSIGEGSFGLWNTTFQGHKCLVTKMHPTCETEIPYLDCDSIPKTVQSWNQEPASDSGSETANKKPSFQGFPSSKWITPFERAWKPVFKNVARSCVHFFAVICSFEKMCKRKAFWELGVALPCDNYVIQL